MTRTTISLPFSPEDIRKGIVSDPLHPASYETLRQLWKLHGRDKLIRALNEIEMAAGRGRAEMRVGGGTRT